MPPDRNVGNRFVGRRPPGGLNEGKRWRVVQRGDNGPEVWQVRSTKLQLPTFDDLPPGEPPPEVGEVDPVSLEGGSRSGRLGPSTWLDHTANKFE